HRFGCWPRRSSHGRDHLGYQPCTLTRGPAPKSTTTLFCVSFLLFFLRKLGSEVLKKVRMACAQHAENVAPVFAAGSPAVRRDESVSPRRLFNALARLCGGVAAWFIALLSIRFSSTRASDWQLPSA